MSLPRLAFAAMAIAIATLPAAAQPAANAAGAQPLSVVMTNFKFTPNELRLHHGTAYRLEFTNRGTSDHNFTSPEFFSAVSVAPEDRSKVVDGTVEVDEGQTVSVRVEALKPGSYPFHCSHFLHASFGMTGSATID
jgi:plastocyanin